MAATTLSRAELSAAGNAWQSNGFGKASNRELGCPLSCIAFCVHRLEGLIQVASKGDSVCSLQENHSHVTAERRCYLKSVQCRRSPFCVGTALQQRLPISNCLSLGHPLCKAMWVSFGLLIQLWSPRDRCAMHWYNDDAVRWNDPSAYKRADTRSEQ